MNISTYESKINALEAGGGGGGGGGATATIHTTAIDDNNFSIPVADMVNLISGSVDKVLFIHPYPPEDTDSIEEILRFSGNDYYQDIPGYYYAGFSIKNPSHADYILAGNSNGVPMIFNVFMNGATYNFSSLDGGHAIYKK